MTTRGRSILKRNPTALPNRTPYGWKDRPRATGQAIHLLLKRGFAGGDGGRNADGDASCRGAGRAAAEHSIIRDAEIEALVQDYARPIFGAAGIRAQAIEIFIVPDPTFNAFVATPRSMFLNAGALLDAQTPNEMIGVIAHETGHLAGAHLVRMQQMIRDVSLASTIAGVIAMGALIGAAQAGHPEIAASSQGVLAGLGEAAKRDLLSYARSIETEADRSAITYLGKTQQSGKGMLSVFSRLANDNLLLARDANPYLLTHPLPRERIALLEELVTKSKFYGAKDPPALQRRHDLMRAKLSGFTESRQRVAKRYPASDNSVAARYARAILAYRFDGVQRATPLIDSLTGSRTRQPLLLGVKGADLPRSRPSQGGRAPAQEGRFLGFGARLPVRPPADPAGPGTRRFRVTVP